MLLQVHVWEYYVNVKDSEVQSGAVAIRKLRGVVYRIIALVSAFVGIHISLECLSSLIRRIKYFFNHHPNIDNE
jgi:hypothetical protein